MIFAKCPDCNKFTRFHIWHIHSARLPWWYYAECAECHYCTKDKLFVKRLKKHLTKVTKCGIISIENKERG